MADDQREDMYSTKRLRDMTRHLLEHPEPRPAPREIVVFWHWADAQSAGFRPMQREHPEVPGLECHVFRTGPESPEHLRGREWSRVTISGRICEAAHRGARDAYELVHALRAGLRVRPCLWVEM